MNTYNKQDENNKLHVNSGQVRFANKKVTLPFFLVFRDLRIRNYKEECANV